MEINISNEMIWTGVGASVASVIGFVVSRIVKKRDDEEQAEQITIATLNSSVLKLTIQMELTNQRLEVLPKVVNDLNALHRKVAELNVRVSQ